MDCVFFRHLDSAGRFFSPDSHSPGFRPGTVAVEDRSASAQNGTQRSAAYKQLFFCSGLGTLTPPESVRVPFWHAFLVFSTFIFEVHARMLAFVLPLARFLFPPREKGTSALIACFRSIFSPLF